MHPTQKDVNAKLESLVRQINEIGGECAQNSQIGAACSYKHQSLLIQCVIVSELLENASEPKDFKKVQKFIDDLVPQSDELMLKVMSMTD